MVIAFSSIGLTFHPSNLTALGSQSFAEPSGDSKGHSPWRAFGDLPRGGKVTRGRRGGAPSPRGVQRGVAPRIVSSKPGCRAERLHHGRSAGEGPSPPPIEHWAREGPKNQKAAPTMDAAFWFGLLV